MRRAVWLVVALAVCTTLSASATDANAEAEAEDWSLADSDDNRATEAGVPFWGDELLEIDDDYDAIRGGEPEAELVLTETDDDIDIDIDDADGDGDADADADADNDGGSSAIGSSAASASASVSLMENDARFRHDVALQSSSWAAMLADAKHYQSNVLRSRSTANAKAKANARNGVRSGMRLNANAKGGACAGIISANCKHTGDMQGSIPDSAAWQDECAKLICNPLCLRYTWDVKIVAEGGPDGFEDAVNALGTQYSLGAQFRAHACGKVAGCCEENEDLLNWVELRNFAGMFPESPQPALACDLRANGAGEGSGKDDLCSACKEAITIEAEVKDEACDYFVKVPDPSDMGDEDDVFARNGKSAAAEIPKHKSFKEKCEAVQGLMGGIISGLASGEWKEKACSCLGCCEADPGSECYYPVVYGTADEAHTAHKSF